MEELFMETITKLSERVKQLERSRSSGSNRRSDEDAHDDADIYASATMAPSSGANRMTRIEPGGRIRSVNPSVGTSANHGTVGSALGYLQHRQGRS